MVSAALLATFCGTAVSLTLALPLGRCHTRSLYNRLTFTRLEREGRRARVRLRRIGRHGLGYWRKLGQEGRCMQEKSTVFCTHSEAADLGWGETVSMDFQAGADGAPSQGLWIPEERSKTTALREMRALRRVLESLPAPRGAAGGSANPTASRTRSRSENF